MVVLAPFLFFVFKALNSGKKYLFLAQCSKQSPSWRKCGGSRNLKQLVTLYQKRRAIYECWCSASPHSSFMQSRIQPREWCHPQWSSHLSYYDQIALHSCAQGPTAKSAFNLVELTIHTNITLVSKWIISKINASISLNQMLWGNGLCTDSLVSNRAGVLNPGGTRGW